VFFKSIIGGLGTLLHWQVWVALLIYVLASFGWLMLIGAIMGRSDSGVRQGAGCLTHMIGGTVFHGLLLGLFVLVLTPIMLGGNRFLPLSFFKSLALPILVACIYAIVAVLILSFVPIIGNLISDIPGVADFIKGVIIFRFFSESYIETELRRAGLPTEIYPGFWASIGYLLIAIVLIYGCWLGFSLLGVKISKSRFYEDESVNFLIGSIVLPLFGLLPLFMYAKHVYLAIERMI